MKFRFWLIGFFVFLLVASPAFAAKKSTSSQLAEQRAELKNLEENLINALRSLNVEIVEKYIKLLTKYEKIVVDYVDRKIDTSIIKKSTMSFINQIASKNSKIIPASISANFIEYINSIIFVYDNASLNDEVFNRIKNDTNEIILEFNRNNYNFVIESINKIIKNIISEV